MRSLLHVLPPFFSRSHLLFILHQSIHPSNHPFVNPLIHPSTHSSNRPSIFHHPSKNVSLSLCFYSSSIHPPIHPSIHLLFTIHPRTFLCPSVCLFICLCICMSVSFQKTWDIVHRT